MHASWCISRRAADAQNLARPESGTIVSVRDRAGDGPTFSAEFKASSFIQRQTDGSDTTRNTAAFTYDVSGRMQGDVDEDVAEIDQTDILVLRAACRLLLAGINVAVSYDVQFADQWVRVGQGIYRSTCHPAAF